MRIRAIHQIVYGKAKVAQPGDVVELTRADFTREDVERLLELGAATLVEEEEPVREDPPAPPPPPATATRRPAASKPSPEPSADPAGDQKPE